MNQELRRIKNKDLSILDERLFGNLDKVQTINSTLQNLQQFQQFLLYQIGQFEDQAKSKIKKKQVNEVIEQNCLTLRQSILRVVPDLQTSRARLKSDTYPKQSPKNYRKQEEDIRRCGKQVDRTKILIFAKNNQEEVKQMRKQIQKIKSELKKISQSLWKQFTQKTQVKVFQLIRQNNSLKAQNQNLKNQNKKLSSQIKSLKELANKSQTVQSILQVGDQDDKVKNALSIPNASTRQNLAFTQIKKSQNPNPSKDSCKPFADKMKFNLQFSGKLGKFFQKQAKINEQSKISANFQQIPSTFRQQNTLFFETSYNYQQSGQVFRSIELGKSHYHQAKQMSPDVPKLLRRNSFVNNYKSYGTQSVSKARNPLQSCNLDYNKKSSYCSVEKAGNNGSRCAGTQSCEKYRVNNQSSQTKSNHNLMRKTKSNFFKKQGHKQNIQSTPNHMPISIYQSNVAKLKGLINPIHESSYTKVPSKQKLRIFSIL